MRLDRHCIPSRQEILHFHDFTTLTYLEFDIRVLRFRRGSELFYPPLAEMITTGLQELNIIINEMDVIATLHKLFDGLSTAGCKDLRTFYVRLPLAVNSKAELSTRRPSKY